MFRFRNKKALAEDSQHLQNFREELENEVVARFEIPIDSHSKEQESSNSSK